MMHCELRGYVTRGCGSEQTNRRQNGDQQMLVAKMVTMVNDPPDEQHEQYHCDDVDKKDDVKLMSEQGL